MEIETTDKSQNEGFLKMENLGKRTSITKWAEEMKERISSIEKINEIKTAVKIFNVNHF